MDIKGKINDLKSIDFEIHKLIDERREILIALISGLAKAEMYDVLKIDLQRLYRSFQ